MTLLVIPMAGHGSRFKAAGYTTPKPLLPVGNWSMFEVVLANLYDSSLTEAILVTMDGMVADSRLQELSDVSGLNIRQLRLRTRTDGAATTVAAALNSLPLASSDRKLIVANCDQYIDADLASLHASLGPMRSSILTMEDNDPKWSYARLGRDGKVDLVEEKKVISPYATSGVYGFSSCSVFLSGYKKMTAANCRVNGEFYVAPVYNFLPSEEAVSIINLGPVGSVMHGLGIPSDYETFLESGVLSKAVQATSDLFAPEYF